jgi:hypothetical protein
VKINVKKKEEKKNVKENWKIKNLLILACSGWNLDFFFCGNGCSNLKICIDLRKDSLDNFN